MVFFRITSIKKEPFLVSSIKKKTTEIDQNKIK